MDDILKVKKSFGSNEGGGRQGQGLAKKIRRDFINIHSKVSARQFLDIDSAYCYHSIQTQTRYSRNFSAGSRLFVYLLVNQSGAQKNVFTNPFSHRAISRPPKRVASSYNQCLGC